ncbi:MAG: hypothetical protein AABX71_03535 [Nanoarchaeota archaeon]
MTNDTQSPRQKSPVEIARQNLESTLLQGIAGGNIVLKNQSEYGTLGVSGGEATYKASMNSDEVKKMREKAHQDAQEEYDRLGVYGQPAYLDDGQISAKVMRQLEEYRKVIPLKELGDIVKGVAPGFEFSVPAELENYVPIELFPKIARAQLAKEAGEKAEELTEVEQDAFNVYQLLSQAYKRGLGLRAAQSGSFADLNQVANQISEKYRKPEKKE